MNATVKIDPTKTWRLAEQRLASETDPIRRRNLAIVIEHMKGEALCDIARVMATISANPKYVWHSAPDDPALNPQGSHAAVEEFYDMAIVRTGAHRLEWDVDRIIVDEHSVFTEGMMRLAYPGRTLLDMDIAVDDPDAYYLSEARTGVVWPIEAETGLIIGEEIYKCVDEMAGIADRKIAFEDIGLVPAGT